MKILLGVACLTLLAGCATFDELDCGTDWYVIGRRDGVLGAQPQEENYARRCAVPVDAVRYRDGWSDGYRRRARPAA